MQHQGEQVDASGNTSTSTSSCTSSTSGAPRARKSCCANELDSQQQDFHLQQQLVSWHQFNAFNRHHYQQLEGLASPRHALHHLARRDFHQDHASGAYPLPTDQRQPMPAAQQAVAAAAVAAVVAAVVNRLGGNTTNSNNSNNNLSPIHQQQLVEQSTGDQICKTIPSPRSPSSQLRHPNNQQSPLDLKLLPCVFDGNEIEIDAHDSSFDYLRANVLDTNRGSTCSATDRERLEPAKGKSRKSSTLLRSEQKSTPIVQETEKISNSPVQNSSNSQSQQQQPQQQQQATSTNSPVTSSKQRRLYRCRHCGFETDKKVENWQHIRIHMRPEKLLACESCQFVTEYKHHLEYHQRNHSGYKPFKCDNCDYQCVNKSMLNSHMKSHSSVYQYQCGDCKYATKYVHSLKMHLRKYNHQPTQLMIDVYGRKRGPKSTSSSSSSTQEQQCILDLRVDSKLS